MLCLCAVAEKMPIMPLHTPSMQPFRAMIRMLDFVSHASYQLHLFLRGFMNGSTAAFLRGGATPVIPGGLGGGRAPG